MRALEGEITRARRRLEQLWAAAAGADRLFAVDRLLREGTLDPTVAARLAVVQDALRDAWVASRVNRVLKHRVPVDVRRADLQFALAERARDAFLQEEQLFDALFLVAEGFIRPVLAQGPSFRDLWHQREIVVSQLVVFAAPLDEGIRGSSEADS